LAAGVHHLKGSLESIPGPSARRLAVRVTVPAERHLRDGHPWLYDTSIESGDGPAAPGDLAVVFDRKRRFLAAGLYDPTSPIRVRVLQAGESASIDREFFAGRIRAAASLRSPLRTGDARRTDGFRLINGESDLLPGLVVDRYADTLVAKLYTSAWIPRLAEILPALLEIEPAARLVLRLNRSMREHPDFLHGLSDGQVLHGPALEGPVVFSENGILFEAEPVGGQKTGFFLDQRDNRSRVESLARGLDVLNVFSYTGGFSVYSARGGARSVTSVDLSSPAIAATDRNLSLNRRDRAIAACPHRGIAGDAFEVLSAMAREGRRFGLVVLDPPMFAQSKAQVPAALAAYARLTRLGLSVLAPGGVLVQASCSNRVPAEEFFGTLHQAAMECGRPLREIERTGHALDHAARFPGAEYLKCLFART
jgi:23S rRNA (cytosine1962-C5)-methyltransferase